MCRSLTYYPLCFDEDSGKQKVLFQYGYHINNRDSYDDFIGRQYNLFEKKIIKDKGYKVLDWISVPCGCCDECLNDRARSWAYRILLEASQYKYNYFITLTYDDEHLPKDRNLVKDEISKFNKKLKVYMSRRGLDSQFRFYGVGEYGSKSSRCHYHEILFNCEIPDLEYYKTSSNGDIYYNSQFLNEVWNKGFVVVAKVDIGSACYVARYCDKKKLLTKKEKSELISKGIVPEFSVMSRRPGIGSFAYNKIVDNVKGGVYKMPYKDNIFGIPKVFVDKMKKEFVDSPFMKEFIDSRKFNSSVRISKLLYDSDLVDNLDDVLKRDMEWHLNLKKERDF